MSDKAGKESQYIVLRPETGFDPPIGSDRGSGRDISYQNILLCHFVAEAVSVLGKPIIIYNFNTIQ